MARGIGDTAVISKVRLKEQSVNPDAPASTYAYLFAKAENVYLKQADGTVLAPRMVLTVNSTPVGNVGTGEDNLITYSVPANMLLVNGQYLRFEMAGTFAASANNKRVRVYFGSTLLFDTGALAITAAGDWIVRGTILRTGAATQRCMTEFISNEAAMLASCDYVDATETLSGALTLKATGEATADNDIVQKFLLVEK